MAYEGLMNLYLGETPKTTNPDVWNDMQEVYRAIHLLNAGFGEYSKSRGSGGPDKKPWEAMAFERWFYSEAAEDISQGAIVTAVNFRGRPASGGSFTQYTGIVKGAPMYAGYPYSVKSNNGTFREPSYGSGLVGVALEACKKGELCKVGIGPGILQVEGINPGDTIMAYRFAFYENPSAPTANPIINQESVRGPISKTFLPHGAMVVGYGVAKDSVMIMPFMDYAADQSASQAWNTPYEGGPVSNN